MDIEEMAKEAEAVNGAEEWLLKARRVRRLIEQRVKEGVSLDSILVVRVPGVEAEGEPAKAQEPTAAAQE